MIEESDLLAHAENFPIAKTDEEWEEFWAEKEPHDEYCTQEPCTCLLIRLVMEREVNKLTNLRGYVIMTTERYNELVNRPQVPF